MHCRFKIFILIFLMAVSSVFSEDSRLKFNSWELIIYRPENSSHLLNERLWFRAEDEKGQDVTYEKIKATYEWTSISDKANYYQKRYYLDMGMAMHLLIQKGKYRFYFYTDKSESNGYEYDTENPAKVLFVYPSANDNGFYDGGWIVDYKAPAWFKFAKPRMR